MAPSSANPRMVPFGSHLPFFPLTSSYFFFSISDADVVRFLKILTFLSIDEISQIESEMRSPGYVPNTAQGGLPRRSPVLSMVKRTRGGAQGYSGLEAWKTIETIAGDVPSISLQQDQVLNLSLLDLSVRTGLLESKSAGPVPSSQAGGTLFEEQQN
ncbi:UNVERIFIED_CONTAM: Tyrosine--tRNA ligase, chloroplastic/mitochondrial [Sesamum latifolium]|uniref:Tyrosine--tRNA ligase, chloroplastic/mitochondrial n=1 Tax=Sesamum latifolium TaxID=2727402 RepID=A0AAW2XJ48_9LAMI